MGDTVCGVCSESISGNKVLACFMCETSYHSKCLNQWKDCSVPQLQVLKSPGVVWYCEPCRPKLKQWVFAPKLEDKLSSSTTDIQRKLEHNTLEIQKISKLLTDNLNQSRDFAEQARISCDRMAAQGEQSVNISNQLAEDFHKKAEQEEAIARRCNTILCGLAESMYVEDYMLDTLYNLDFNSRVMKQSYRLGRQDSNRKTPRPVKIVFESEWVRNRFMMAYNKWSKRGECFAVPDRPKAVREAEYKLRQERNTLIDQNPGKKYRIRNGKIWEQNGSEWRVLPGRQVGVLQSPVPGVLAGPRSPLASPHLRQGLTLSPRSAWSAPGAVGGFSPRFNRPQDLNRVNES